MHPLDRVATANLRKLISTQSQIQVLSTLQLQNIAADMTV